MIRITITRGLGGPHCVIRQDGNEGCVSLVPTDKADANTLMRAIASAIKEYTAMHVETDDDTPVEVEPTKEAVDERE